MYTLTLDNGTTFLDLLVNGSYFVSKSEVTSSMFNGWKGKCRIELTSGEDTYNLAGEHEGLKLFDLRKGAHAWYFAIRKISPDEIASERDRADIDYIAMMTGVAL